MWWILGILISTYVLSTIAVLTQFNTIKTKYNKCFIYISAFTPILNSVFMWEIFKIYVNTIKEKFFN